MSLVFIIDCTLLLLMKYLKYNNRLYVSWESNIIQALHFKFWKHQHQKVSSLFFFIFIHYL